MSRDIIWTKEVIEYVTEQRDAKNCDWGQIVRRLKQHYNITTTSKNLQTQYWRKKQKVKNTNKKESENMNWRNEPATRKQCKYIAKLTQPNASKTVKKGIEDALFAQSISGNLTKQMASEQIISLENIVKEVEEKPQSNNRKGVIKRRWTKKEDELLMNCKNSQDLLALSKEIGRTMSSTSQRYYSKKKSLREMLSEPKKKKSPAKKTKTYKKRPNTELHKKKQYNKWTKEEDFDLVCNFYELSIDQAKSRYGDRTYGTIAARLEKLVDSDKPEVKAMLIEASIIIKARKKASQKPTKLNRKQRRELRKQKKIDKKTAKLENKLNKLRRF
tara:strand:+ start:175 stop:1164 length:990 start_codon:yes stop_codon:yes gene_type:complete